MPSNMQPGIMKLGLRYYHFRVKDIMQVIRSVTKHVSDQENLMISVEKLVSISLVTSKKRHNVKRKISMWSFFG